MAREAEGQSIQGKNETKGFVLVGEKRSHLLDVACLYKTMQNDLPISRSELLAE